MPTMFQASTNESAHHPVGNAIERYFELSLFAMIVVGFLTLAATGKLDFISLVSVVFALGLRAHHLARNRKIHLSERTTTKLTLGYVAFYALDFFFLSGSFISATVHLVLFIMVVKIFSVQRERDLVYLAIISFLMVLAAAILTVDAFFLGAFFVFLLLSVSTFVSMEMRRSLRETGEDGTRDSRTTEAAGPSQISRRMARSLAATSILLVGTIAMCAVAIFFILPRISAGRFTALGTRGEFTSGFSDVVQLGAIGRIKQSDSVVMHVQFPKPTMPPADLRWRGVSLNAFNGMNWSNRLPRKFVQSGADGQINLQNMLQDSPIRGRKADAMPIRRRNPGPVVRYRVIMEPIDTDIFFFLPMPLTLSSDVRDLAISESGSVFTWDPGRSIRIYVGFSDVSEPGMETRLSEPGDYPEFVRNNYLELPAALDARIPRLAEDLSRDRKSTYEKAAAIEQHLKTQYEYTLQMFTAPGEDPLAYFLFTRKAGHCEYFASSMAVMLRTLGIPSRIVNGFHNGEYNDLTGSYIVRARDAHSWVEAYLPGYGWATFDPTPPDDATTHLGWSRISLYMDALSEFWREWVINYDFSRQSSLAVNSISRTRKFVDQTRIWIREKYELLLEQARKTQAKAAREPGPWGIRILIFAGAATFLVNLRRIIHYFRGYRLARSPASSPKAAASLWYERMVRLLNKRGFKRGPAQTPQEFVNTLHDEKVRSAVATFTGHYERARFGASADDAGKLPELYEEIDLAVRK